MRAEEFVPSLIESFVVSLQSNSLASKPIDINRPSGVSTHFSGRALDTILAGGWAGRLGTKLFRLKYGLDATEYRTVMIEYRRIANDAAHVLGWPDDELTGFMAEFVLLAWLTDRLIWTKDELIERAEVMRKLIIEEEKKTASHMATVLL